MLALTFEDLAALDTLTCKQRTHHGLHLDDLLHLQLVLPGEVGEVSFNLGG